MNKATCFCAAGDALFQTHENLEHLAMMEAVLGPLPEHMARAANRQAAKYFTPRCALEPWRVLQHAHRSTHVNRQHMCWALTSHPDCVRRRRQTPATHTLQVLASGAS